MEGMVRGVGRGGAVRVGVRGLDRGLLPAPMDRGPARVLRPMSVPSLFPLDLAPICWVPAVRGVRIVP